MDASSNTRPGLRPHHSVHGGIVVLRPALDACTDDLGPPAATAPPEPPSELHATMLEMFEIGPPIVDPRDESNPTWVEEHSDDTVELLELSEALSRVDESERGALVAEHLAVLAELSTHHRTVTGSGHTGGGEVWCPWCVADPESHAASLQYAIVYRTGELIDALTLYGAGILGDHADAVTELLRGDHPR